MIEEAVCQAPPNGASPILPIHILKLPKRKVARARIRQGVIEVVIPQRWSRHLQNSVSEKLAERVQKQFDKDYQLFHACREPLISFHQKEELVAWIHRINAETFQVPLKGIRMGSSKYTRLAQMNLKTHVMTVSKHCLRQVPEEALRYLVLHELAHLLVPNHSAAFWNEVKRFVPDVKYQRNLISAVHRIRVYEAEVAAAKTIALPSRIQKAPAQQKAVSRVKQLLLNWTR